MIGIQTKSSVRYKSSVSIFIEGGFYIDMSLQSIFRKLMRIMIKTLNANNITGNNLLTFCTFITHYFDNHIACAKFYGKTRLLENKNIMAPSMRSVN